MEVEREDGSRELSRGLVEVRPSLRGAKLPELDETTLQ